VRGRARRDAVLRAAHLCPPFSPRPPLPTRSDTHAHDLLAVRAAEPAEVGRALDDRAEEARPQVLRLLRRDYRVRHGEEKGNRATRRPLLFRLPSATHDARPPRAPPRRARVPAHAPARRLGPAQARPAATRIHPPADAAPAARPRWAASRAPRASTARSRTSWRRRMYAHTPRSCSSTSPACALPPPPSLPPLTRLPAATRRGPARPRAELRPGAGARRRPGRRAAAVRRARRARVRGRSARRTLRRDARAPHARHARADGRQARGVHDDARAAARRRCAPGRHGQARSGSLSPYPDRALTDTQTRSSPPSSRASRRTTSSCSRAPPQACTPASSPPRSRTPSRSRRRTGRSLPAASSRATSCSRRGC
jgi:hypothetical protein